MAKTKGALRPKTKLPASRSARALIMPRHPNGGFLPALPLKAEYPAQLYEHMASGLSFESYAGTLGISRDTLYNWADASEPGAPAIRAEMAAAKASGEAAGLLWWETLGRMGAQGLGPRVLLKEVHKQDEHGNPIVEKTYGAAPFNVAAWIFTMKNRFAWRDRDDAPGIDAGHPLHVVMDLGATTLTAAGRGNGHAVPAPTNGAHR